MKCAKLILAGAFATIATPALAVDPAKVPVLAAQMRVISEMARGSYANISLRLAE
jgi:hypothetical protein